MINTDHLRIHHVSTASILLAFALPFTVAAEDGGIASISQVGDANRATIEQKFVASGGYSGGQNTASVVQSGNGIRADIAQEGSGNNADLTQNGTSLTATVTQNGHNNTSQIEQYGSGHAAEVYQTGNGFGISITQDNMYGAAASNPPSTTIVHQY